jgi:penicillin-binding protein 1A
VPVDSNISIWTRLKRVALGFDSWVNTALFEGGRGMSGAWDAYSRQINRLRMRGIKRGVLDLTSEAATLGVAGGVVMVMLAIPAFRETSDNWLKSQELAVTFLDRYGQEIGRRGIRHNDSYKLEEFPDHLIKAALATEDRRFYEHWGIDPLGTLRAITVNARGGGVVQGGSSITQQLAKNLFLTNERSMERKIKEAFLALWLEFHLSKDEILKLYLDRAYMGGGAHGAAAATEYYFGKSVKDLTLAESAMLAGLFKAPTKYAPHVNLPAARARANEVLSNMVEAGFLTEGQIQTARRNPASPVNRAREISPDFYLDWAFGQVKQLVASGKLGNERVLTVKTPLDLAVQRRSEQVLEDMLRQHGRQYDADQGALVIMDVDGAVRAMVGGRDYGNSQFNRATDALRQPGSSFKPFVYAAMLTANPKMRPNTIVTDSPVCLGNWCPKNYNGSFSGSMPLTSALARSINSIPVKFSIDLGRSLATDNTAARKGRAVIIDLAHKMGLTHPLTDSTSLAIGSAEVTVLDMTAAYAVFANGGKRATPYATFEVRNSQGDVVYRHDRDSPQPQVLEPRVVADMNFMMTKVVEEGTARRAALEGIRSAGKTGTTNAYRDAWYVGYTGNLVAAVWYGNDDHTSTKDMTGGTLPAMTWKEVMSFAHQNMEIRPIPGLSPDANTPVAFASGRAQTATAPTTGGGTIAPGTLSRRSYEVIGGIGGLIRSVQPPPAPAPAQQTGSTTQTRASAAPAEPAPRRVAMP